MVCGWCQHASMTRDLALATILTQCSQFIQFRTGLQLYPPDVLTPLPLYMDTHCHELSLNTPQYPALGICVSTALTMLFSSESVTGLSHLAHPLCMCVVIPPIYKLYIYGYKGTKNCNSNNAADFSKSVWVLPSTSQLSLSVIGLDCCQLQLGPTPTNCITAAKCQPQSVSDWQKKELKLTVCPNHEVVLKALAALSTAAIQITSPEGHPCNKSGNCHTNNIKSLVQYSSEGKGKDLFAIKYMSENR